MSIELLALAAIVVLLLAVLVQAWRYWRPGEACPRAECLWSGVPREAALVMDAARLGLWCYAPQPDRLTLDARARLLLGLARVESSWEEFLERVHPEDRSSLRAAWENGEAQGEALAMEFRAADGQGQYRHLSLSAHALGNRGCGACRSPVLRGTLRDMSEHRRLENALREKEARFAAMFRSSPVGIAISRIDDGTLVDMNQAFLDIFGMSRAEAVGLTSTALDLWSSPEQRQAAIHSIRAEGRSYSGERRVRRRDGQLRHLLTCLDIVWLEQEPHLQWVLQDVTEHRHSAALASRSEILTQAVMDSLEVAVAVLDREGEILRVNRKWAEFALENGASGRLQLGEGVNYFEVCRRSFPEASAREALEAMQAVLAGRQAVASVEYPCHSPARERWFLLQVTALGEGIEGLVTIHVDITARRQAETALRQRLELQEQLAKVADSVPGVICSFKRRADGSYCMPYALQGLVDILGVPPEAVVNDFGPIVERLNPEDRQRIFDTVEASAQSMTPWHAEFRILHPERGERWVEGRSIPSREADGSVFWHGFIHDISARKQAAAELTRSRDQLRALTERLQSVREEERTRISREIHDQLGQNLTVLKLDVNWLKGRLLPEQQEQAAKVGCMGLLIDDTLQTVRTISWELRPGILDTLGLGAGIEWLVDDFRRRIGIRATVTVPAGRLDLPDALATPLFRICQELLTNVARHAEANRVEVRLARDGDGLLLEVRDNGRGMARLPASGSSLGLLGIRERAAQCGGVVDILTFPEIGGTQVRVRIPITIKEEEDDNEHSRSG